MNISAKEFHIFCILTIFLVEAYLGPKCEISLKMAEISVRCQKFLHEHIRKKRIFCILTNFPLEALWGPKCEIAIKMLAHLGCVLVRLFWLVCRILAKFGHSR